MGQDIRELLKNDKFFDAPQIEGLSEDHDLRFLDKLNAALPEEGEGDVKTEIPQGFLDKLNAALPEEEVAEVQDEVKEITLPSSRKKAYYSIAASAAVLFALSSYFFTETETNLQQAPAENVYQLSDNSKEIIPSLADVSPEFKKVEDYYLASINLELANLKVNSENKSIVDSFMKQLSKLDEEYKLLQKELHSQGTLTISLEALIDNLQMRLELLQQLKQNLKNINEPNTTTYQNLQA